MQEKVEFYETPRARKFNGDNCREKIQVSRAVNNFAKHALERRLYLSRNDRRVIGK